MYEQALELARTLTPGTDFTLDGDAIRLTQPAAWRLERLVAPLSGIWSARGRREELVSWALEAIHYLQRDVDYRVENGRVLFPPPAPDAEEPGPDELELRKLVEVKEGCQLSSVPEVLARLSVPRFLSRYAALAGICADAGGVEKDFWALYSLRTVRAGPPSEARAPAYRVFLTAQAKHAAVIERSQSGPVVVAVRSRAQAQALQGDMQIPITALPVLQAPPSQDEAIELLVAELPVAGRHIAQAWRAYGARSCTLLLSLDDEAVASAIPASVKWLMRVSARASGELTPRWARWVAQRAQRALERNQRMARQDVKARERLLDDLLAVSGRGE
jgi:preprotein translocase subunit SecA